MTTLTKDHNNHPAHSPLTSRRLHQMRDILSKASAQRDGGDIGYAMSDAVKLIDEVLAGAGQKPVATVHHDDKGYHALLSCELPEGTPLYTTQPVPVVPDEIDVNDPALDTHRKWMAEGWNRCRTAMLNHSGESNEKDKPVMFIDGNISPEDAEKLIAAIEEFNREPRDAQVMIAEPVSEPYKLPATLIKAMQSAIDQLDRRAGKIDRGYPQHSHSVSGVWDQSNGRIANEPCSVCALWDEMRGYLMVTPLREVK